MRKFKQQRTNYSDNPAWLSEFETVTVIVSVTVLYRFLTCLLNDAHCSAADIPKCSLPKRRLHNCADIAPASWGEAVEKRVVGATDHEAIIPHGSGLLSFKFDAAYHVHCTLCWDLVVMVISGTPELPASGFPSSQLMMWQSILSVTRRQCKDGTGEGSRQTKY